jgi:hypothetical protein
MMPGGYLSFPRVLTCCPATGRNTIQSPGTGSAELFSEPWNSPSGRGAGNNNLQVLKELLVTELFPHLYKDMVQAIPLAFPVIEQVQHLLVVPDRCSIPLRFFLFQGVSSEEPLQVSNPDITIVNLPENVLECLQSAQ